MTDLLRKPVATPRWRGTSRRRPKRRAGGRWLLDRRHDPKGAFNLVEPALQDLGMPGLQPDPLRLGIEIVQGLGEAQRQDDRLKLASDLKTNDPRS